MAMAATYGGLSTAEHSAQLRKAVIASTIGTAIEWYDFFLYGTAAGLIFGKLYFPNEDALDGDACGLRHLFHRLCRAADRRRDIRPLRRSHRPQGDADRDASVHGHRDLPHRIRADLCLDRHLGRGDPDDTADGSGHRRRRRVGRIGAAGDGMVAHHGQRGLVASWPQFGVPCGLFLANLAILAFSTWSGDQFDTWGWRIPFALSIILVGIGLWIRLGILETPVFQQLLKQQDREGSHHRGLHEAAEGDHPVGIAAHVRAGAVLHLHRLHLRLRGRHAAHVARLHPGGGAGGVVVSFVTIPLSGHISDRIGRRKMYLIGAATIGLFGFLYFGMVDTAIPSAVFIAIVLSLIPHDMQYGPQAALIAEAFTPRLRYSGASLGYQLASVIAGGPAPLIATALFALTSRATRSRSTLPPARS